MKKNQLMRAGVLTASLALATSCFVGGTFAKYVTSGEGTDTARVAKFGVTVTANGSTFAKEYAKNDSSFIVAANSVVSSNDDKLVAPGTSGNMTSMTLTGTPEVAVRVSYDATFEIGNNWTAKEAKYDDASNTDAETFYCPLEITVNTTTISGLNYESADEFEAAVDEAIKKYSKEYEANTNLANVTDDSLGVSWAWNFEGDDGSKQTNVKDTYLGDKAAAGKDITVSLDIKTTVTQID